MLDIKAKKLQTKLRVLTFISGEHICYFYVSCKEQNSSINLFFKIMLSGKGQKQTLAQLNNWKNVRK